MPCPASAQQQALPGAAATRNFLLLFSGYTRPATIYQLRHRHVADGNLRRAEFPFDPDNFVTQQRIFYPSKDGTSIPMYLIRRRDILQRRTGPPPTLLFGYGGFNIAQTPGFFRHAHGLALEQGRVLAIASLRGQQIWRGLARCGPAAQPAKCVRRFHRRGRISEGQWLHHPGGLAIEGRSNGGLLVGAVVNQRPDLFAAAIPPSASWTCAFRSVHRSRRYWVERLRPSGSGGGFPQPARLFAYHNIRSGLAYPAVLVTTADNDDRVVPATASNMPPRFRPQIGDRPHLIRIETRRRRRRKPVDKLDRRICRHLCLRGLLDRAFLSPTPPNRTEPAPRSFRGLPQAARAYPCLLDGFGGERSHGDVREMHDGLSGGGDAGGVRPARRRRGWGGGWDRGRHHRGDGFDFGDFLLGGLLVGTVAVLASNKARGDVPAARRSP